jgi:hypothetical protein
MSAIPRPKGELSVPEQYVNDPSLNWAKRILLGRISGLHAMNGCFATPADLGKYLERGESTVRNLLQELFASGHLRAEWRPNPFHPGQPVRFLVPCFPAAGKSAPSSKSSTGARLPAAGKPARRCSKSSKSVLENQHVVLRSESQSLVLESAAAPSRGTPVVESGRKGGEASSAPASDAARACPPPASEKAAAAAGMDKEPRAGTPDGLTPLGQIAPRIQEQLDAAERDADGPQPPENPPPAVPATEEPTLSLPTYPPLPHEATLTWGCVIDRTAPKERQRAAEEWALAFTLLVNEKVEDGPAAELATLRGLNHVRGALWRWQRDKAGGKGVGWLVDMLRLNWSLPPPPQAEKPPDKGAEKQAQIEAAAEDAYRATQAYVRALWEDATHVHEPAATDRAVDQALAEVPENETLRLLRQRRLERAAGETP